MEFVVIKPRGEAKIVQTPKQFETYDVSKIQSYSTFVQQMVGTEAENIVVGDYLLWVSKPDTQVVIENEVVTIPSNINLTSNLFLNETEIAYGSVVVTANAKLMKDKYEGLAPQDVGNIMNAFTNSNSMLVEDKYTKKVVAVDRIFDRLLAPNGIEQQPTMNEPQVVVPVYPHVVEDPNK